MGIRHSGWFWSFSRLIRSFCWHGSILPECRGELFRSKWGNSFGSDFKGVLFWPHIWPDLRAGGFRPGLFIIPVFPFT